jgi:hypothetical protein
MFNPVLEKDADCEPDIIRVASGRFINPLPSPTNEPVKELVTEVKTNVLAKPLLPSLSETKIAGFVSNEAENEGIPKFGSTWDKSTNSYLSDVTFLGPFNRTLPLNRLLIAISTF